MFWAHKILVMSNFDNRYILRNSMQHSLLVVFSNRMISNFYTDMLAAMRMCHIVSDEMEQILTILTDRSLLCRSREAL